MRKMKKKQDQVSTMQKTGWSNYSSLLVWSCLQKGFTYGCDHMGFFVIFLKFGRCLPWCMKVISYDILLLYYWPTMSDGNSEVVKFAIQYPLRFALKKMISTLNVNKSTMKGGREDVDTPFWSWDTGLSGACWPKWLKVCEKSRACIAYITICPEIWFIWWLCFFTEPFYLL